MVRMTDIQARREGYSTQACRRRIERQPFAISQPLSARRLYARETADAIAEAFPPEATAGANAQAAL